LATTNSAIDSDSESTAVSETASNGRVLRIEGMQYRMPDLGVFAALLGGEQRICLRREIVWIGRLFPVTEIQSVAFSSSLLNSIIISRTIEILGSDCFSFCGSLSSISLESNSKLKRIESEAFSGSSLKLIIIPRNVEILGSHCFWRCASFSSILIESDSKMRQIESEAFLGRG
jgi:hypothetical protein